jgi:Na+/H+-dicarboxylate symporter
MTPATAAGSGLLSSGWVAQSVMHMPARVMQSGGMANRNFLMTDSIRSLKQWFRRLCMPEKQEMGLTTKIMIGMGAGLILGILTNLFLADVVFVQKYVVDGLLKVIGSIFVASLKMMVVPLVFVSLVGGVTAMGNVKKLGRIGLKALVLYIATTTIAITIALTLAVVVSPGEGMKLDSKSAAFTAKEAPPLGDVIINMVPSNPVQAMAQGEMLQVIVFALLFGIAITLAGERGKHVLNFFNDLDSVIMKMVDIVMALAPIGVFALIARTFAGQGIDLIKPLMGYFLVVVGAMAIHLTGTLSVLIKVLAGLNPVRFFMKMRSVMLFAFSTASSNATIPVNLKAAEEKLGVDNSVASFTIPLGATINMDGTAIMQGVATVFIANVYAVNLSLSDYLTVIMTATLA